MSRLGLLPVIYRKFVKELWPFIDARIWFPLNIFRTNGHISPYFVYALILTRSWLRFLPAIFYKFAVELWPLIKDD